MKFDNLISAFSPTFLYLYMTRDGVFRHARLEPLLTYLEARGVDGHPRLEVVDAAKHEVDGAASQTSRLDASHEVVKVFDGRDVVVVSLELDVGVDGLQSLGCCRNLGQPSLMIENFLFSGYIYGVEDVF